MKAMRKLLTGCACVVLLGGTGYGAIARAPKADNTAQNYGALEKGAVTADKQGNAKSEVETLAAIRKSIIAEKGLSLDAQNVKILYSDNGKVILRGPVNSKAEKLRVGELTKRCAGVTSLKNELTVAGKPH